MFLRTTKVKRPDGKVDEYIRLVESDWNNGSPRHRVICNLGRKELLAPHAEALLRLLQGKEKTKTTNQEGTAVVPGVAGGGRAFVQPAAPGPGQRPTVATVVSDAGPVAGAAKTNREGIVSALAESVFLKRRSSFLRFDFHLFRGERSAGICAAWT